MSEQAAEKGNEAGAEANEKSLRKLPRSRAEILDIEDRLDQIRQNFKNLRREMQESGEEYVELCLGHVYHCLEKLEQLSAKGYGEFGRQLTAKESAKRKKQATVAAMQRVSQ
jgi:hypothetical protein